MQLVEIIIQAGSQVVLLLTWSKHSRGLEGLMQGGHRLIHHPSSAAKTSKDSLIEPSVQPLRITSPPPCPDSEVNYTFIFYVSLSPLIELQEILDYYYITFKYVMGFFY